MEYSVKDLVKILLKKWYFILLIVAVTVTASYFLAQRSYQQAVADYQNYTTAVQSTEAKTGTLTVAYSIRAKTESENFIQVYTNFLVHHNFSDSEATLTMDDIADLAIQSLEPHLEATLTDKDILETAEIPVNNVSFTNQTKVTTPGTGTPPATKPFEICYLGNGRFHITLTGVTESDGQQTLQTYIKELTQTLSTPALEYQIDKISYVFNADKPVLTDSAKLAQLVMNKPSQTAAQASAVLKRMCIAAVFSFALACIIILVVTFIRDAAETEKKEKAAQENHTDDT